MRFSVGVTCMAKLNLTFSILGTLPDGYHDIDTLYQSVDIDDTIIFTFDDSFKEVRFATTGNEVPPEFPLDESNLMIKAIKLYQNEVEAARQTGVEIRISKQIPIGAGMAGGSANAAAALFAMNIYCEKALDIKGLRKLGSLLGSDVPFCIRGGTARGKNRGEVLQFLPNYPVIKFLVAKPKKLSISTAEMFKAFDEQPIFPDKRANTKSAAFALVKPDLKKLARCMGNDFEPLVFSLYPELEAICQEMMDNNALAAHLTGSGPTVFGFFEDELNLRITKEKLEYKFSDLSVWSCQSSPFGVAGLGVYK